MSYDALRLRQYSTPMVIRLLYRLLLQRLDRGAGAAPRESAVGRPGNVVAGSQSRRHRIPAVVGVIGAAALAVAVLTVLVPEPPATNDAAKAVLRLSIPAVDAKPLVVYLRGSDLAPPAVGVEPSTAHRIRSTNGRFSPEFQIVPPAAIVEMTNADSTAHNTHVFNRGETVFNVALPVRGVKVRKVLTGDGVFDVRCDMHPWMRAWMFVSPSRHYAVVREPTTVTFSGIAPGDYVLHDWQPNRPEGIRPVRLAAGETRHLRLR